jgi:predicted aconitase
VQFVNDTCWCMLTEPVVPVGSEALITNSAKYAHYAPGLVSGSFQMAKERALLLALALDSALWCCHHINHITAIV